MQHTVSTYFSRAYVEDPKSQGIDLFATGDVIIESLYVATMGSIFD